MVISEPWAAVSGTSIWVSALFAQASPLKRIMKRTATDKRMSFLFFISSPFRLKFTK
jgi:hypothetical protein